MAARRGCHRRVGRLLGPGGLATVMSKEALGFVPPFTLLAGQLVASVLFLVRRSGFLGRLS
jgi:hypothetical protein